MKTSFFKHLTLFLLCIPFEFFAQITPPKQYFTVEISPENAPKVD